MRIKSALYGAIAALALSGTAAFAAPVQVGISSTSFTPGAGFGIDNVESTSASTLLDVRFSTAGFSALNFGLDDIGASRTFTMGTIQFAEPNSHQGIIGAETDHLDLTAILTFTNPLGTEFRVETIGRAVTGSVSDNAMDLSFVWTPAQLAFGNGGLLQIALQETSFTNVGTKDQVVTVTYLQAPVVNAVPEPASLALMGLGMAGLALARRRRD